MTEPSSVAERLATVRERIAQAARRAGRDPDSVTLVGVAKRKPPELVAEAVRAGLRHVGENYLQEAARKIPELRAELGPDGPEPHLSGGTWRRSTPGSRKRS